MELVNEINAKEEKWTNLNLGESAILKARIGWQGLTTAEYLDSGSYYLVTGTDFKNGYIDWDNCVYVEKNRYDQDKNIQIRVGDVLVTKDGTIGKVAYVDRVLKPTTLNSGVFVIRPKNKSFDSRYFYYVLRSNYFRDFLLKLTAGSTISHLYQKDFVYFNFPLPPLPEQKAIAQVLSDTDALLRALEEKIAKKRAIKQGAMQDLLRPKEGWEVKGFSEITKSIIGGGTPSRSNPLFWGNEIPWVTVKDFTTFNPFMTQEYVTKRGLDNSASNLIRKGTLITSTRMALGKAVIYQVDVCINQDLKAIIPNSNVITEFLYYWFEFNSKKIEELGSGSTVMGLSLPDLKKIKVNLPLLKEQTRIATILSDMDREIEALEGKLAKYRQMKQGLMQQLLTGKVRLV